MRLRVTIADMLSVHARQAVFTALAGVSGVRWAEVEMGSALVECDETAREGEIRAAVEEVGCRVVGIRKELPIS
jgi:copper chaperone CopZ